MSLTTDDIDDIKQLITANNAVLLTEFDERMEQKLEEKLEQKLDEKLDQKLDEKLAPINQKIDDLTDFVREAIDTSNEATGQQLADHERRIVRLEKRTA